MKDINIINSEKSIIKTKLQKTLLTILSFYVLSTTYTYGQVDKPSKPILISPITTPYFTCGDAVDIEVMLTNGTVKWEISTNTTAQIVDINALKTKVVGLEANKTIIVKAVSSSGEEISFDIIQTSDMTSPILQSDFSVCEKSIPIGGYNDLLIVGANSNAIMPETGVWTVFNGVNVSPLGNVTNLQLGENVIQYEIFNEICPSNVTRMIITVLDDKDKNCSITSLTPQKEETTIYPNPFTNTIIINNVSSNIDKIELVDVYGNVVEETSTPSENVEMGENVISGTYFIYLHSLENVEIQKVVKIN